MEIFLQKKKKLYSKLPTHFEKNFLKICHYWYFQIHRTSVKFYLSETNSEQPVGLKIERLYWINSTKSPDIGWQKK